MTEHMTAEMQIAKAYRDEADQLRKQATAELAEARELRDQAARDRRDIAEAEAAITRRELRLAQLNEAELVAREKAVAEKLKQAEELIASVDKERRAAAINLSQLIEHDKRELAAAGIEY